MQSVKHSKLSCKQNKNVEENFMNKIRKIYGFLEISRYKVIFIS